MNPGFQEQRKTIKSQEMEVEEKFNSGMLTKMSKITDLMSKLEGLVGLEGVNGEDQTRCRKCLIFQLDILSCQGKDMNMAIPHVRTADQCAA